MADDAPAPSSAPDLAALRAAAAQAAAEAAEARAAAAQAALDAALAAAGQGGEGRPQASPETTNAQPQPSTPSPPRSEERRVGKECPV